jgi:4-amino-4-deoxy-L-arabinose transferase-like glycosyltransferase
VEISECVTVASDMSEALLQTKSIHDSTSQTASELLTARRAILILTVIYAILSFWNLSAQNVSNPDEPRLAVGAHQMIRTGDWLVPQFNAQQHLTKPIFFYWLIATTSRVGQAVGLSEVEGFRLGPIFMGFMAMIAVFLIGRRIRNVRCGFLAAGIAITAFTFHGLSRLLVVDMTLCGFLFWAWFIFLVALEKLEKQASAFPILLAFYTTLGLACMTKGPGVIAVFVVVPACAYLYWDGKIGLLKKAGLWWGAPLALLIGHWWFIVLHFRGIDMWYWLIRENFGRIGGLDHLRPIPFVFYLEALLGAFAPWIVLLPFAIRATFRRWRERQAHPFPSELKMLCCCILIPFTFLGLAVTKRPIYMLPLYPWLSLFVAYYLEDAFLSNRFEFTPKPWVKALRFVCPILVAAIAVTASQLMRNKVPIDILTAPASIAFFLLVLVFSYAVPWAIEKQLWFRALSFAILLSASALLFYENVVVTAADRRADTPHFFADVGSLLHGRRLIMYADNLNEAVWYLDVDTTGREIKHIRKDPRNPILETANWVILLPTEAFERTPELKTQLTVEATLNRGGELYTLGIANELKFMSLDGSLTSTSTE